MPNEAVASFSDADFQEYIQRYNVANLPIGKSDQIASIPNRDDIIMRRTTPMGGFFPEHASQLIEHQQIMETRLGELASRGILIPSFRSYRVDTCPWTLQPAIYTVVEKVAVGTLLSSPGNEKAILETGHALLDNLAAIPDGEPQIWGISKREQYSVGGTSGDNPMLIDLDYYLTRDPRRFFPKFMDWLTVGKGTSYEADFNDLRRRTQSARTSAQHAYQATPACQQPLWPKRIAQHTTVPLARAANTSKNSSVSRETNRELPFVTNGFTVRLGYTVSRLAHEKTTTFPGSASVSRTDGHIGQETDNTESNYTPQPTHDLHFPQDELAALAARTDLQRIPESEAIFEIPGHPDKLLRRESMQYFAAHAGIPAATVTKAWCRSHMAKFETNIDRLESLGIRILRRTTRLHETDDDIELLTVVERHPNPKTFDDNYTIETASKHLDTIEAILSYLNTTEQPIWDIDGPMQYATDKTLLDYDPFPSTPGDRVRMLAGLHEWLCDIPAGHGEPERHEKLLSQLKRLLREEIDSHEPGSLKLYEEQLERHIAKQQTKE